MSDLTTEPTSAAITTPQSKSTSGARTGIPALQDLTACKDEKGNWQVSRWHRENIIPEGDWIWVFGSDLGGRHKAGAAKIAHVNFRAEYGVSNGKSGRAYAIPVTDKHGVTLSAEDISDAVSDFVLFAKANPKMKFFITASSMPAEYSQTIARIFYDTPKNCALPVQWRPAS